MLKVQMFHVNKSSAEKMIKVITTVHQISENESNV